VVAITWKGLLWSRARLITLILLVAIAYSTAVIQGGEIKQMGVQKYVARVKESYNDSEYKKGISSYVHFVLRIVVGDLSFMLNNCSDRA
jgi:hypothetical protein